MNNKPIKLFSASAGSGKTYTLTLEYIKLALSTVESKGYFRRILAVTFTNKAADEMKKRIIDFLYLIAQNNFLETSNSKSYTESEKLISKILSDFHSDNIDLSKEELILRAKNTLNQILQDYGLFSVQTIDSFVQKLSQSFIEELNLPDQFEVNLDQKQLLNDLIEDILDQINQDSAQELKHAILDFSLSEVEEDKSWNSLRENLQEFLLVLFEEEYLEREKHIAAFTIDDFRIIEKQIIEFYENSIVRLSQLAHRVQELVNRNGIPLNEFANGANGPISIMSKFLHEPQLEGKPYAYFVRVLDSGVWYGSKASSGVKQAIEQITNELNEWGGAFLTIYQHASRKYAVLRLIKKNLKKFALLNFIQQKLSTYQHENGIISISEFSKKINQVIANDPIPFIYEKLGERYHHILIDEFQDTSLLQWKNFMPLVEHATSFSHKSLIVGDAKQSIYKFRGGEVGLIASLFSGNLHFVEGKFETDSLDTHRMETILTQIAAENLGSNFRSSFEIVDFNNNFYAWFQNNVAIAKQYPLIQEVFGKHLTQNPETKLINQSNISFAFYKVSDDRPLVRNEEMDWTVNYVNDLIERYINEQGFSFRDIAVLTRGNKEANFLAVELKKRGKEITSSDSLLLNYSSSIRFILSLLQLINEPNSKLYNFEVLRNYQVLFSVDSVEEKQFNEFKKLRNKPIKEVILTVVHEYSLFELNTEIAYLLRFLDFVDDYLLRKSNDWDAFFAHFAQNKHTLSINGNAALDAITISTIHKSKGLEYPIVILPFANWPINPKYGNKWLDFAEIDDLNELQVNEKALTYHLLPVVSDSYQYFEPLQEQISKEEEAAALEAINVLYVATTRPKLNLHFVSRQVDDAAVTRTKTEFQNSVSKILFDYCESNQLEIANETEFVTCYQLKKSLQKKDLHSSKGYLTYSISPATVKQADRPLLRHQQAIEDEFTQTAKRQEIGTYIHDLVAKNSINALELELNSYKQQLDENFHPIIDGLLSLIHNKDYAHLFDLDSSILNEQEIIDQEGNIYRPDRIAKLADTFVVIDYKTGKPKENHKQQIENYKLKMQELGMQPIIGKIVYMTESRVEHV